MLNIDALVTLVSVLLLTTIQSSIIFLKVPGKYYLVEESACVEMFFCSLCVETHGDSREPFGVYWF